MFVSKENTEPNEELSICSPLLVSSLCQLLFNFTILMSKEAVLMVNNHGIINLLVSYVKPINLLTISNDSSNNRINENIIYMLTWICKYLNLCCQIDQNCVLMLLKSGANNSSNGSSSSNSNNSLVFDLIECLNLNEANKFKLKPFYSVLFELLSTFLSQYEDKTIVDSCLIIISKCWLIISSYLINDLLSNDNIQGETNGEQYGSNHNDMKQSCASLFENALRFYSIYLAKLTQLSPDTLGQSTSSRSIRVLCENISYLFDSIEISQLSNTNSCKHDLSTSEIDSSLSNQSSLGAMLTRRLIKLFDKYFLVDTNQSLKQIMSNLIKGLFALSNTAKEVAVECKLLFFLIINLYLLNLII